MGNFGRLRYYLERISTTDFKLRHYQIQTLSAEFRQYQLRPVACLRRPSSVSVSHNGSPTDPNLSAREFFNIWAASWGGIRAGSWRRHPGLNRAGKGQNS